MMKGEGAAIVWFRDDLRVADNPALSAAAASRAPVVCIYIFDEAVEGARPMGAASRWWLHGSLDALDESLTKLGSRLRVLKGNTHSIWDQLIASEEIAGVYWNRRYSAAEVQLDSALKAMLTDKGVSCESFNGSLMYEPWEVKTAAGASMRVFTPFWRAARAKREPAIPLPAPKSLKGPKAAPKGMKPVSIASLGLKPTKPNWAKGFAPVFTPGETGARARLSEFLEESLNGYAEDRNRPDKPATSRLSPHLRFGDISPRQVWHAGHQHALGARRDVQSDFDKFSSELGWREFAYHLLFHHPDLATENFQQRFNAFPWSKNEKYLEAWRRGRTGYPMVDAGMRELWTTGWMHNRVRMVVASFLVKHLLIDWREGEEWFWDTLVDADPANNTASWQWVAGTGADAAPYFRVFNPVLQGEKFDPKGAYVRRWIPEIANLPDDLIHRPWEASAPELKAAGVALGKTYPKPIVDHGAARDRALEAFAVIKSPEAADDVRKSRT